jgi:alpha-galactosidase
LGIDLKMRAGEDHEKWAAAYFGAGLLPPFSFVYDGRPSSQFIANWIFSFEEEKSHDERTERIYTYADPGTGLRVRCELTSFQDFPALEWVLRFKNEAQEDTPLLEGVQSLDGEINVATGGNFLLHRALGSDARKDDFAPIDEPLLPHTQVKLAPVGGRSSNKTALPFFNIEFPRGGGMIIAIGWSGQWAISFARGDGTSLRVRAGMELTHLRLHGREEIRTPRMLLLFWKGDDHLLGHNLLRRFVLAHLMPKKDGRPVTLPFACSSSPLYDEANRATEVNQIDFASRLQRYGVEYLWIDAGWFEGGWPNGVGNWALRKDGFPGGLRPVSDALRKFGMGLLLWFEPERVLQGTWLDRNHPQWVLRLRENPVGLLDLGNAEARRWITDCISHMIEGEGIGVYRQDFNMDPLPYWRAADVPDRQGMAEIRHIEGLYTLWDELLKRHPGLLIDNCASGGRRIDIETASRSVFLWRTDYQYYEPNGYQSHTYGISLYLPSTGTGNAYPDVYAFRSAINNGLVVGWNPYQPDLQPAWSITPPEELAKPFPSERARRLADEYKRVRHIFWGDFYPLTPYSVADDAWLAFQFHRDDLRQGLVLAFRRPKSPQREMRLRLKGLSPSAHYEIRYEDNGMLQIRTGRELAEGLVVAIDNAPGSLLITYRWIVRPLDDENYGS